MEAGLAVSESNSNHSVPVPTHQRAGGSQFLMQASSDQGSWYSLFLLLSTVLCRLPSSAGSNVTFSGRLALTILFKIASYPLPQLSPPSSSAEMFSMVLFNALYHVCIYLVYCLFPMLECKLQSCSRHLKQSLAQAGAQYLPVDYLTE